MIDANLDNSKSKMVADELKLKLIELIKHLRSLPSKRREEIVKALKMPDVKVDKNTLDIFFLTVFLNGKVENNPLLKQFVNEHLSADAEQTAANKATSTRKHKSK